MTELEQKLCELANLLIEEFNPCQIKDGGCLVSVDNPCCKISRFGSPCPYMQNKCKNPNLECKIWFCGTSIKNMDSKCLESFKSLESIAKQFNLTKRPFLGDTNYLGADKL